MASNEILQLAKANEIESMQLEAYVDELYTLQARRTNDRGLGAQLDALVDEYDEQWVKQLINKISSIKKSMYQFS